MQADTLIGRARSGLAKGTRYSSPGVTPSLAASSWPSSGARCDCTGFLAWCLRIPRIVDHPKYQQINGGWFETTGIHADIGASWGYFEELAAPQIGAFVVYPDQDGHDGHIGVISRVNGDNGVAGIDEVIHCSLSGWTDHGDAIRATDAGRWQARPDSRIGWYLGVSG